MLIARQKALPTSALYELPKPQTQGAPQRPIAASSDCFSNEVEKRSTSSTTGRPVKLISGEWKRLFYQSLPLPTCSIITCTKRQ